MNKLMNDVFTEKDNQTYDIVRILYFFACVVLFLCQVYRVLVGHDYSFIDFGGTYSAITAAAAGALALKRKTQTGEL